MPSVGVNAATGQQGGFSYHTELDPRKLAEALRGPEGEVGRALLQLGETVKQNAVRLVGVSKPDPYQQFRSTPPRKPGTLRDSIVKRVDILAGTQLRVKVGSEVPYARWHHDGTPGGQVIVPRTKLWLMYAGRQGEQVFRKRVIRGATPANRFLTRAVEMTQVP